MRIKNYKVKKHSADIETHEVFLDSLAKSNESEVGISDRRFEVPLKNQMAYLLFAIFFLCASILFSRVFYFQIIQGKSMVIEAENNKGSATIVMPERGIIYDRKLQPLVFNIPAYDLVCNRIYFSASSEVIDKEIQLVYESVAITPEDFISRIQNSTLAEVLVVEDIIHEQLLALEKNQQSLEGCSIRKNTTRNYSAGPIFSQLLGYTGRINEREYAVSQGYAINDLIGKTGIEKQYELYLRGIPGESNPRKSTAEKKIKSDVLVDPVSGNNIVLNIDFGLQKILYESLSERIKDIGSKKGAAVAMDPRTGAILALVSYPSYDNNSFSGGISQEDYVEIAENPYQPLFNRAISAQYSTGSVIKPLEAAAALQEKIIAPNKRINDIGYISVPSQYDPSVIYRFGGVKPHGWVDMREALAVSSNIYFYTIGGGYEDQKGLGPKKIKEYLSLFGWNEKTGIDLPGEFSGFIPDPAWKKQTKGSSWVDGDTYNLSIGQSDLQTTPLQVAVAYSALVNGGTIYRPQIANKIISGSGALATVVKQFTPEIIRSNFIDPENLEIIKEGMRDAVIKDYGLSKMLNNLPVSVGSKTGTAQIAIKDRYNLWNASFAPYENPEIVIVITAEEVDGLGAVTLPVTRDVLEYYFKDRLKDK